MSLATLEEFKLYASITKTDKDEMYQSLLDSVSAYIEEYTNLSFTSAPVFDIVSITESGFVVLDEYPITSVNSITLLDIDGADISELPVTQYLPKLKNGTVLFRTLSGIPTSRQFNARVDYTAGYEEVPGPIKQATMDLAQYFFKREYIQTKRTNGGDSLSFSIPNAGLPPHIARSLNLYRDMV
jgi:uncharacterized phiE125 gp8 family phage protein